MTRKPKIELDPSENKSENVIDMFERAVELSEGALTGTHPLREIWTDSDYLCAILAALTNGERARTALLSRAENLRT